MRNIHLLILIIACNILINNKVYAQERKNRLGYILEGSFFRLTCVGIGYERTINRNFSLSIQGNGIFQRNIQGFKVAIEPRFYLKSKRDSSRSCKGWYLGVKPMYMYYHEIGQTYVDSFNRSIPPNTLVIPSNNTLNPNVSNTVVIPPTNNFYLALLLTFGRQWIWKSGFYLNPSIGIGVFEGFRYNPDHTIFQEKSYFFEDIITAEIAVRIGYSF